MRMTISEHEFEKDMERPWGGFIVFADNEQCTAKILFVKAGKKLSLQSHRMRDEHWYCISGKARIMRGPVFDSLQEIKKNLKETIITEGDNIMIPKGTVHTAEGMSDAKILEISKGMFDEKDIVRHEDRYGRK
jgi:mannose-1-phosphate guanylyltransferase